MKKTFSTILGVIFLLTQFVNSSHSQMEFPEDMVKAVFSVEQNGCEATIVATVTVVPKWHINAVKIPEPTFLFPSTLKIKKNANFVLVGGTIEPKPHFMHDEMADEDLYYHEGTFKIKQKIKITGSSDFNVEGYFEFQTCNDVRCLPDYQYPIKVKLKGCPKVEETETVDEENLESKFVKNKNGFAADKEGKEYVFVKSKWHAVPEGNSSEFYKKYIEIKGNE